MSCFLRTNRRNQHFKNLRVAMNTNQINADLRARVARLLQDLPCDANRSDRQPLLASSVWRGKNTFVAGYTWKSLIGDNRQTKETVLGHGDTQEIAVEMMAARLNDQF